MKLVLFAGFNLNYPFLDSLERIDDFITLFNNVKENTVSLKDINALNCLFSQKTFKSS
jgi:hypothetical protein